MCILLLFPLFAQNFLIGFAAISKVIKIAEIPLYSETLIPLYISLSLYICISDSSTLSALYIWTIHYWPDLKMRAKFWRPTLYHSHKTKHMCILPIHRLVYHCLHLYLLFTLLLELRLERKWQVPQFVVRRCSRLFMRAHRICHTGQLLNNGVTWLVVAPAHLFQVRF